jgi:putative phage-type endonuclease
VHGYADEKERSEEVSEIEQLSEAWFAARRGKVTASRLADVTAKTRSGWGASRANYAAELIAERLTGVTVERFRNAAMQHGVDTEPEARNAYSVMHDQEVIEIGFIDHPEIAMTGASPDGLCSDRGMVEIKCPQTATHIETLRGGSIAERYVLQMQWQMACAERDWCDFVSYDPRMPASMSLFVKRVKRNDQQIAVLANAIKNFLAEIDATVNELTEKYGRT